MFAVFVMYTLDSMPVFHKANSHTFNYRVFQCLHDLCFMFVGGNLAPFETSLFLETFSFVSDVAVSDQIAEMLLKAEEFWLQRAKDQTFLSPQLNEHCEEFDKDVSTSVKRLYVAF